MIKYSLHSNCNLCSTTACCLVFLQLQKSKTMSSLSLTQKNQKDFSLFKFFFLRWLSCPSSQMDSRRQTNFQLDAFATCRQLCHSFYFVFVCFFSRRNWNCRLRKSKCTSKCVNAIHFFRSNIFFSRKSFALKKRILEFIYSGLRSLWFMKKKDEIWRRKENEKKKCFPQSRRQSDWLTVVRNAREQKSTKRKKRWKKWCRIRSHVYFFFFCRLLPTRWRRETEAEWKEIEASVISCNQIPVFMTHLLRQWN